MHTVNGKSSTQPCVLADTTKSGSAEKHLPRKGFDHSLTVEEHQGSLAHTESVKTALG
jgi:hypothetical protein